jgi:lipid-binding SYLF domain-containing protein
MNHPKKIMPSIISQTFTEVGNSIKDAYGHVIHGDDPGIYETLVFIARSKPVPVSSIQEDYVERFDLGMTFVEVNDRAFVKDVIPDSDAERAGIRPQDCLQLAIVPAWKFEGRSDKDGKSIKYALECEKNGMRTSFEELRDIFEHCTIRHSKEEVLFTSPSNMDGKGKKERSFRQTLRSTTQEMVGRCSSMSLNSVYSGVSPISPTEHHPVFMVFRHTHSRKKNMGNPHVGLPSFRLDDECERAASIIRRLAPTVDTKHEEDAWDEIVNGATSFLPKEHSCKSETGGAPEDQNTVEASTIRGMIQNALGLAFVRASKVVLGLSFHFGSGIVISRLEDGSWSAPSAIGMYGAGLGLQFGLEVADYIFIIQTSDALDHFRRGTNYTLGGNMGAAVGGMGREAFGAASVSLRDNAAGGEKKEEGNALNLAPIVAYAKSQGLYFGVSFEGSKIFVREDINHRTYQFSTGKECSTDEILSGSVPPPREAEDLYATLHK